MRLKVRKRPDSGLLNKIRKFCAKATNVEDSTSTATYKYGLKNIEDIELPALRRALQHTSDKAVEKLNDLSPLLPQLLRLKMPTVPDNDAPPDELHSFYVTFRDMVLEPLCTEALPYETRDAHFKNFAAGTNRDSKILLLDLLTKVSQELSKFKVYATYQGTRQVAMAISKGPLDAFYGELGDCCANKNYECELERPDFQPVRLFDPKTSEQLGEIYVFTGKVDGHPALIVAGVLPRRNFAESVSKEALVRELIEGLKEVAAENGYVDSHGLPAVYTNAGGPTWGQADGRIAQIYQLHKIIRRLTLPEHQERAILLEDSEVIAFPSTRSDEPIRWIARFA